LITRGAVKNWEELGFDLVAANYMVERAWVMREEVKVKRRGTRRIERKESIREEEDEREDDSRKRVINWNEGGGLVSR
jgi:hypothetical protein